MIVLSRQAWLLQMLRKPPADLGWGAVAGVGGYYIRYREILAETWIGLPDMITGTVVTISGLTAATAYEFRGEHGLHAATTRIPVNSPLTVADARTIMSPMEPWVHAAPIPVNTDITALIGAANGAQDWFTFSTTNAAKNVQVTPGEPARRTTILSVVQIRPGAMARQFAEHRAQRR
ncbi:MAG: fibronectin type III domain-containing protein [Chromatiales bacterium]|nr:fibronectin type III domain-containing protein [Chromatiales bacterium]